MDPVILVLLAVAVGFPVACASAASQAEWETYRFADFVEFSAPADLQPAGGQGIDSQTATWRSDDFEMLIDYGLFADRLDGHSGKPGYEGEQVRISGLDARVVAYDGADGRRVVAAHFPDLEGIGRAPNTLTLSIRARGAEAADSAQRIIRSLKVSS